MAAAIRPFAVEATVLRNDADESVQNKPATR